MDGMARKCSNNMEFIKSARQFNSWNSREDSVAMAYSRIDHFLGTQINA